MMNDDRISIHQTLHGYQDGHSLLESSIELSRESQMTMLILSDLSGSALVNGYSSYITGYSLPDHEIYVLAKTWYAQGMPRPGCVWTHSLLLDDLAISRIEYLYHLHEYFEEPLGNDWVGSYQGNIELSSQSPQSVFEEKNYLVTEQVINAILNLLFNDSNDSVNVFCSSSRPLEKLILDIWSLQWPALRKNFNFSTGSIEDRNIHGIKFDLQVMPIELSYHYSDSNHTLNTNEIEESEFSANDFTNSLVMSLKHNNQEEMIEFIWKYGGEVPPNRKFFKLLTELYLTILKCRNEEVKFNEVIQSIVNMCPEKSEGVLIKEDLLGINSREYFPNISPLNLLISVVEFHESTGLRDANLNLEKRIKDLWTKYKNRLIETAIKFIGEDQNKIKEIYISLILDKISGSDILKIINKKPGILGLIVESHPDLLLSSEIWSENINQNTEILQSIINVSKKDQKHITEFAKSIVDSKNHQILSLCFEKSTNTLVFACLDYISTEKVEFDKRKFKSIIKENQGKFLAWIGTKDEVEHNLFSTIIKHINPNDQRIKLNKSTAWLTFANGSSKILRIHEMVSLLTVGLNNSVKDSEEIVCKLFEPVHDALTNDKISYPQWAIMESNLPNIRWNNWNWCERLKRGVIEKFVRYNWSFSNLERHVKNKGTVKKMNKIYKKYNGEDSRKELKMNCPGCGSAGNKLKSDGKKYVKCVREHKYEVVFNEQSEYCDRKLVVVATSDEGCNVGQEFDVPNDVVF